MNACNSIVLPERLTSAQRAEFVRETATLPPDGVVVGVLEDAARVEGDVRACQTVKS